MSNEELTDKILMEAVMEELLRFFEDDHLYVDERLMILDAVDLLNDVNNPRSRRIIERYERTRNKYDLFREPIKPSNKRGRP